MTTQEELPKNNKSDSQEKTNKLLNYLNIFLPIFGAIATIVSCVFAFLAFTMPNSVQTVLVNLYDIVTPTPEIIFVTQEVTQPPQPTYTFQPTFTVLPQEILIVTATQIPATSSPTPVTIQDAGFVFRDDFEDGLDSQWNVVLGDIGMSNGKLTINAPFSEQHSEHLAVLDNINWGNYSITFELADFDDTGAFVSDNPRAAILLRYEGNKDNIGFYFSGRKLGVQFGIFTQNNEWELYSNSLVTGIDRDFNFDYGPNTIRIDCVGNTYTAYINNKKITSANIPGPEFGKIGVWLLNGTLNPDQTQQHAARIEYITIEALP
ncbi:MAG: hypothetical protein DWQ07_25505 [Chloroflexi bacterium]|nr:MAG: hypothetical protein DWQ07_25505 [Chloroflexota bacterium]MBL1197174.1 hypothetical protein [Chloroflexota bacterium]NOH14468.1 hypothetical protein [Chloroflexota bacterium]